MSYFKWIHISKKLFSRFFPLLRNETLIFIVNWNNFSMCLDSDKKNLHLCSKHVIAMSSRKKQGEISPACVFRSLFRARTGNLLEILFEVCLSFLADSGSKPSWRVSMKYIKM